jgi:hypothetical protein
MHKIQGNNSNRKINFRVFDVDIFDVKIRVGVQTSDENITSSSLNHNSIVIATVIRETRLELSINKYYNASSS